MFFGILLAVTSALLELLPIPQKVEQSGQGNDVASRCLADVVCVTSAIPAAPSMVADQAYRLEIRPTGVTLMASGVAGFRYGQTTLRQLERLSGREGQLPACVITDWPNLRWRGCMLDTSRNYLDLPALRRVLDVMAGYKLNLFHWHLTEDYAWRLESKVLPQLQGKDAFYDPYHTRHAGKFYSQAEFKEIIAYAAERGITVMPEFDVPGHALAFRRAFGYKKMSDVGVTEKIDTLFKELCTLAPTAQMPFVHVGGDEVWKEHEKASPGALEKWYASLGAADRIVVRWAPGAKTTWQGKRIDMIWGREPPSDDGAPCFDARRWYIEEYDPFEISAAATYREPCNWPIAETRKLGAIFCGWHDCAVGLPYDLALRNQCVFPSCVMLGNLFWKGGAGDYPKYANRLPLAGDPLLKAAEDLERRVAAQRDRVLTDLGYSFPFVRQTQMRWRLTDGSTGNIIAEDVPQATVYPFRMRHPKQGFWNHTNGLVVAETWITSDRERDVGVWIGFTAFNRDHGRAYAAPLPKLGEWNVFGAGVEVNGERIAPPRWTNPGQKSGGDLPGVYGFSVITEFPFGNEEYFMREPTKIHLKAGVNHVRLTVPQPKHYNYYCHNWVFTFIPIAGTSDHPQEVTGLTYASRPPVGSAAAAEEALRHRITSLDGMWQFRKAEETACREVRVPHDWAIEGPYNPDEQGKCAKLPWQGKAEYMRTFTLSPDEAALLGAGGQCWLEFDGVMSRPRVAVNGQAVGSWDYGYMSFRLDVTQAVKAGSNELRVTCDTTEQASRWYPGAGLYRSVRKVVAPKGSAVPGSVVVRVTSLTKERAEVAFSCERVAGSTYHRTRIIEKPRRWDVDDPFLYAESVCGATVRFGLREAMFTANDGFHLNGRRVPLKGVNLHADLGPLGMAFDRDAMKRQLLIMKEMGVNALRTSHNPSAPQVLDLCDELGILVWDECFDKWNATAGIRKGDDADEILTRNLQTFVRRDRNHPSVILWSIGNEMRADVKDNCVTAERVVRLREVVRALDTTRPVGAGCDMTDMADQGYWDSLDVTGWNYGRRYLPMRRHKPAMPLVYSESASAYSDYNFYAVPPAAYRDDYTLSARKTDSYDHTSAPWSDIPDIEFARMATDRYVAGEFVWTGIDYLGEPCPYWNRKDMPEREQARSSYFGICDLCGLPKDRYYLYRALWNTAKETCHLVPHHWNFDAAASTSASSRVTVPVYVYTSGDEAELFLNGKSLGRRQKKPLPADYPLDFEGMNVKKYPTFTENPYYRVCDTYRLRWLAVTYEPGELKAVCYKKGKKIGEDIVRTAGPAAKVRLTYDPQSCGKLLFVVAERLDARDVPLPGDDGEITFAVSGDGMLAATGNGNPRDYVPFSVPTRGFYGGRAVLLIRRNGPGSINIRATVKGLPDATLTLGHECEL